MKVVEKNTPLSVGTILSIAASLVLIMSPALPARHYLQPPDTPNRRTEPHRSSHLISWR
jgi:hypothetical protein